MMFNEADVIEEKVIDGKKYFYYDDGSVQIIEPNGEYKVFDKNGFLLEICEIPSENHYITTSFFEDGKIEYIFEDNNGVNYDRRFDRNGNLVFKYENNISTDYTYDENNILTEVVETNPALNSKRITNYKGISVDEEYLVNDRMISSKKIVNDVLIKELNYDYYENGHLKTVLKKMKYYDLSNEETYIYDESGNLQISNDFYKDGKLFVHLEDDVRSVMCDEDGNYSFLGEDGASLTIYQNGVKSFDYSDYYNDYSYNMSMNPDGTYAISYKNGMSSKGTYTTSSNGHIICTDQNNNKYEYSSIGLLIKKEVDGVSYEYDNSKKSEKKTINGKTTYALQNHIEYDEDAYETLMKGMVSICDTYPTQVNSACSSCVNQVNSLYDKYSTGGIDNVNNSVQSIISSINDVKESINYSLLAYSTCDKHLEEKTHYLIDSLFDDSETTLARVFKKDINSYIEDSDKDKILEYKENTNFDMLYKTALPLNKEIDKDGNTWYYNIKDELVGVTGLNPKINYGGEEFKVEVLDSGVLKLTDSKGEPLNIFADYNIASNQFGGNQEVFSHHWPLMDDNNIQNVLSKYFDAGINEDTFGYLDRVSETSCGHTAMTNMVFKEFEGRETEFYNTFGYPMYKIKKGNTGNTVDYNYEPLILELYSNQNARDKSMATTKNTGNGVLSHNVKMMYDYLHDEYGIFDMDYNEYIKDSGMFGDGGYTLYDLYGNERIKNGGAHAMVKLGELEDGRWIVSTWGQKMICEPNEPTDYCVSIKE